MFGGITNSPGAQLFSQNICILNLDIKLSRDIVHKLAHVGRFAEEMQELCFF
jgi:hypothetical protein